MYQRVAIPHVLVGFFGSKYKLQSVFARIVDSFQTNFRFYLMRQDNVEKKNIELFFGSNWFSLPNDAVEYILHNKKQIDDIFEKGRNTDELFIQTILGNVKAFADRMISPRRFIDWSAGLAHPKVLTMFDYQRMIMSDAFFARKFDDSIDKEIIDKIVLGVKNED